jgi:hypothetical protein
MIKPSDIVFLRDGGSANMGDVTDQTDLNARFTLDERFVLVFARCHFGSTGTGTATVSLKRDSWMETNYDVTLDTFDAKGITSTAGDADLNFRVENPTELVHYTFEAGDFLVFEWTNPDSGNITWGMEVGLARAEDAD